MAEELYWMADGVVHLNDKEYGADTPLPVKDITPKILAKWKKSGKVGAKIAPIEVGGDKAMADLTAKVAEKDVEIKDLTAKVAEKDVEIETLNKQVADLTEPEKK